MYYLYQRQIPLSPILCLFLEFEIFQNLDIIAWRQL